MESKLPFFLIHNRLFNVISIARQLYSLNFMTFPATLLTRNIISPLRLRREYHLLRAPKLEAPVNPEAVALPTADLNRSYPSHPGNGYRWQ
jgi:hypothetical protein